MTKMYGMRRANGDWFALEDHGQLRVPVFHSSHSAMQARACDTGMLLFRPVILDERAVKELRPTGDESGVRFWVAGGSPTNSTHGYLIDHAQLALLIHQQTELVQG